MEEFIIALPRAEQLIVRKLRKLILDSDPRIREQFSYGVPYYFNRRRVCFIWPSSAPQGPKGGIVSFGLCYGYLLSNAQGVLKMEGRTQVAVVPFKDVSEVKDQLINEILQEALLVDSLTLARKIKKNYG